MPVRDATTQWQGDLQTGSGVVTLDSSNAGQFPVTFPSRANDDPDGRTSPEELVAAAHSACYAMSLANNLAKLGTPATSLGVTAEVTLGRGDAGLTITAIRLTVDAAAPGIEEASFQEQVQAAKVGCPISRALAAVEDIRVTATLRS